MEWVPVRTVWCRGVRPELLNGMYMHEKLAPLVQKVDYETYLGPYVWLTIDKEEDTPELWKKIDEVFEALALECLLEWSG